MKVETYCEELGNGGKGLGLYRWGMEVEEYDKLAAPTAQYMTLMPAGKGFGRTDGSMPCRWPDAEMMAVNSSQCYMPLDGGEIVHLPLQTGWPGLCHVSMEMEECDQFAAPRHAMAGGEMDILSATGSMLACHVGRLSSSVRTKCEGRAQWAILFHFLRVTLERSELLAVPPTRYVKDCVTGSR
jgi:hypothetical protein